MTQKPFTVTITDAQNAGFCGSGIYMVVRALGGDMRQFMTEGYPIDHLEKIDDAHVQRVVQAARRRIANGQG